MDLSLPPELSCDPSALVAFAGLDKTKNTVHQDLWTRFSSDMGGNRLPLRFVSAEDMEWPAMKPKRNSYEWFIPKGILKKNWMKKHLEQLPAVVVVFADLDWNDPNFNQLKSDCAQRVQNVRTSLSGRGTKIAMVLIQQDLSLPLVSDDVTAAERAAALCAACELSNRSLFVLPVTAENMDGYIIRLENAFYELAQNYYHQEIRSIKSHRDYLNKTTHLYLFVRHQFKIGFLNELKKDYHAAYKHYGQAYSLLMEVRATDTNIMEVKTIAGFISYKICKLAFRVNLPRDAISQFRKHMDIFQQKVGMDVLAFEHKGWQSKQSELFADVFTEAIDNGLPAIQTQHPGLYYQQAAQYAIARRELADEHCSEVKDYPNPDPLQNSTGLEFFGQRPWRPGKVSLEPPDMEMETQGVQALLHQERNQVDHSSGIIGLLQKAIAQFKNFRSPRSESHLTVNMAEELKTAQKYREALDLLAPVMCQYRDERWRPLLDAVLALGVKCAFLLGDVANYAALCLDLCSPESSVSEEEKARVAGNVVDLLEGRVPKPEPGLASKVESAAITEASKMWTNLLANKVDNVVTVDMTGKSSGISTNVNFLSKEFKANQTVKIAAKVKNNFVGESNILSVSQVKVSLSNTEHVLEWSAPDQEEEKVVPNKATVKTFEFMPKVNDVGESLNVNVVSVVVGKKGGLRLNMTNTVSDYLDAVDGRFIIPRMPPLSSEDAVDGMSDICLDNNALSAEILQRDPLVKMSLNYDAPALVGEWFPVEVVLNNNEDNSASQMEVTACLVDAFDPIIADTTTLTFDPSSAAVNARTSSSSSAATPGTQDDRQPLLVKSLGMLERGMEAKCRLYVKCSTTGERGIRVRVSYSVQTDGDLVCNSSISDFLNVDTKEPFSLDSSLLSVRLRPIQQAYTDEPFFLSPKLKALTAHPISILDSYMEPRPPLKLACSEHRSQIKGCVLGKDFETKECIPVTVRRQDLLAALDVQEIAMGRYVIKWKRQDSKGDKSSTTSTTFDVPVVRLRMSGLHLTTRLPSHGVVRTPMVFSFRLHNRTERTMEFTLAMEPSESFMLSGNKQMQARVLPGKERRFSYVLYPLVAGEKVELPRLRLTPARINQSAQDPESILERLLPRTVTVLPKARTREDDGKKSRKQDADELDSAGGGFYILGEHIVLENLPHDQRRPKPKLRY